MSRPVALVIEGMATSDGAGVRLTRTLGSPRLDHLDPFLLLDEFKSDDANDYIAGFPDHPHRGFETVTYLLAGSLRHEDHSGHAGDLQAGSVQWMTAGRGIIHSEMPQQEDGLLWGFQLWVNLPAARKMCEPRYQEFEPTAIPVAELDNGVRIRVIAGETAGVHGPVVGIATAPLYLDVAVPGDTTASLPVAAGHCAFAYVFDGAVTFGSDRVTAGHLVVFEDGSRVDAATDAGGGRFLLIAGRPIGEPIARYGPFVMNTREEILTAVRDYQTGRLQR